MYTRVERQVHEQIILALYLLQARAADASDFCAGFAHARTHAPACACTHIFTRWHLQTTTHNTHAHTDRSDFYAGISISALIIFVAVSVSVGFVKQTFVSTLALLAITCVGTWRYMRTKEDLEKRAFTLLKINRFVSGESQRILSTLIPPNVLARLEVQRQVE